MKEHFDVICETLDFNTGDELFNNFEEVLQDSGASRWHAIPYSVPMVHEEAFLKELKHLLEIGVLHKCGPTEWLCPTFIIPKKDGRIRWISDLRELNKCIKRRQYPLPLIHDIVNRRKGYQYFTKIDLTMFYYNHCVCGG